MLNTHQLRPTHACNSNCEKGAFCMVNGVGAGNLPAPWRSKTVSVMNKWISNPASRASFAKPIHWICIHYRSTALKTRSAHKQRRRRAVLFGVRGLLPCSFPALKVERRAGSITQTWTQKWSFIRNQEGDAKGKMSILLQLTSAAFPSLFDSRLRERESGQT